MMVLIAHQAPQRLRIDVPSFVTSQDLIPQPHRHSRFFRRIDDAITLKMAMASALLGMLAPSATYLTP